MSNPSVLSNYLGNLVLATYFTGSKQYLALHVDDPTPTGDTATELRGGAYRRCKLTWGAAANRSVVNTSSPLFTGLPAATVTYLGLWDAAVAGHLLASFEILNSNGNPSPFLIPVNGAVSLIPGDLAFSL